VIRFGPNFQHKQTIRIRHTPQPEQTRNQIHDDLRGEVFFFLRNPSILGNLTAQFLCQLLKCFFYNFIFQLSLGWGSRDLNLRKKDKI
jgi:hypothetical protein